MRVHRLLAGGDPDTGMEKSDLVPPEAFTTEDRTELIHYVHLDEKAGVSSGVWKCAPCREVIDAYPVNEQMTVLSGSVTVTNSDGTQNVFGPGDTFFFAKGTPCVWEITETLHKFFMISE